MKCECKECKFRGMELCEHRKLLDENAKMRGIYDREYLNKLKVSQHEGELIDLNHELLAENSKLREALKPILEFKASPAKWMVLDEMYHNAFYAICKSQSIAKEIEDGREHS